MSYQLRIALLALVWVVSVVFLIGGIADVFFGVER